MYTLSKHASMKRATSLVWEQLDFPSRPCRSGASIELLLKSRQHVYPAGSSLPTGYTTCYVYIQAHSHLSNPQEYSRIAAPVAASLVRQCLARTRTKACNAVSSALYWIRNGRQLSHTMNCNL